jgi:hypothetical protein
MYGIVRFADLLLYVVRILPTTMTSGIGAAEYVLQIGMELFLDFNKC